MSGRGRGRRGRGLAAGRGGGRGGGGGGRGGGGGGGVGGPRAQLAADGAWRGRLHGGLVVVLPGVLSAHEAGPGGAESPPGPD